MEWTKLFLEQFVQIIHYVAWPGVVLIVLLVFRKELRDVIGRFTEYEGRHGIFRFSKTSKPPSPGPSEASEIPTELSNEAKRILATLWQRQTYHFKDDFTRRWSFRILPHVDEYGIFMQGFAELLKPGLVSWTRKDGQALLTDKGIAYLNKHPEIQTSDDVYRFDN
ncbi:MAG TPA: hypothetical protein VJJ98_14035 [Sedimentisphaerales bacterium]|nr:hypothetical protein [Sedimentisphaerales bacterium]